MLAGLTKGVVGVGEMLTMADKGGRGGGIPPFLADIICEQPLTSKLNRKYKNCQRLKVFSPAIHEFLNS